MSTAPPRPTLPPLTAQHRGRVDQATFLFDLKDDIDTIHLSGERKDEEEDPTRTPAAKSPGNYFQV